MYYSFECMEFVHVHVCELYFDLKLRYSAKHQDASDDADENLVQSQFTCAMIQKYMSNPETLPKIEFPLGDSQIRVFEKELTYAIKQGM